MTPVNPSATLILMKKPAFLFLGLLLSAPFLASAAVVINEIAWMGSNVDGIESTKWQYYEWIELYNSGNNPVDLTGWILSIEGKKDIPLENTISANSYYFLERSGYHAFVDISADLATSFGTGLANSGAILILKDSVGVEMDRVDGNDNWKIGDGEIIGNNTTKETAQRISSGWITATATPKAVNYILPEQPPQQQTETQESGTSGGGGGSSTPYVPPEKLPKIKADAGEDKTVTVGANAEFRGKAYGLDNKPLDNARYLWTFGDGASKEGQNITHIYRYPGEYIVFLNVSSGEYSSVDKILVKAMPNQVFISEIKTGADSFIELQNKSNGEIDISGIHLKSGNQIFIFPQNSRIRPSAYLVIPSAVSSIVLADNQGTVEMLYPGGFKADSLGYSGVLGEGQSFNRMEGTFIISQETPGAKNLTPTPFVVGAPISPTKVSESVGVVKSSDFAENHEVKEPESPQKSSEQAKDSSENAEVAGIIKTVNTDDAKNNSKIYLFAVLGLAAVVGAGVFFIRRHRQA